MNSNIYICILLFYAAFSCKQKDLHLAEINDGPPSAYSYDLQHPHLQWSLPPVLDEISGNYWLDQNHLLVIEDLRASLYVLRLDKTAVIENTLVFKDGEEKKFDIEDVTAIDNTVYALRSHGVIYRIKDWKNKMKVKKIETFLTKENNPEGICYDPVSHNLLVACKGASGIDASKKSTRAVYMFDTGADTLVKTPFLILLRSKLEKLAGEPVDFNPSAIAVHPVTNDIYILSSRGTKCMARFNRKGDLLSFQFIDAALLPQPEGICFSPDGILYISSEGKDSRGKICEYLKK